MIDPKVLLANFKAKRGWYELLRQKVPLFLKIFCSKSIFFIVALDVRSHFLGLGLIINWG